MHVRHGPAFSGPSSLNGSETFVTASSVSSETGRIKLAGTSSGLLGHWVLLMQELGPRALGRQVLGPTVLTGNTQALLPEGGGGVCRGRKLFPFRLASAVHGAGSFRVPADQSAVQCSAVQCSAAAHRVSEVGSAGAAPGTPRGLRRCFSKKQSGKPLPSSSPTLVKAALTAWPFTP